MSLPYPYVYRRPDDVVPTASGEVVTERERHRRHDRRRRARMCARTDDELARDLRAAFPSGFAVCVDCGRERPVEEFPLSRSHRSTRRRYCFPCKDLRLASAEQAARLSACA